MATGHKPGGGLHSRTVKHTTAPKVEPRARAINPSAVNQLGNFVGDHVTNRDSTGYRGEPLVRGPGYNAPLGITDPVKAVGVGGGRTIYKTGYQDQHGRPAPGNPPAQGRDTLSEFGPDYRKP
jgi:hypothetical protein